MHLIGEVPDAARDGVLDQHSNNQRSFAMKSPRLAKIATSPANRERRSTSASARSTMQSNLEIGPECYSTCIQPGVATPLQAGCAGCLKLCAIYDIRTNDLMARLAWMMALGC